MAFNITLGQYNKYVLALGKKWMPTVRKGLRSGGMKSVRILRQATMKAPTGSRSAGAQGFFGAYNIGNYKRAWKWKDTEEGIAIYNDVPYAPIIEYGRRPGKGVSQQGQIAIARWAQRKLKVPENKARGVAYCIARIHKRLGLKGRRVLRDAIPQIKTALLEGVKNELLKALAKV